MPGSTNRPKQPGSHGHAAGADVGPASALAIGEPTTDAEGFLHAFFHGSPTSKAAEGQFLGRIYSKTEGRDKDTTWQTRNAQYDAVLGHRPDMTERFLRYVDALAPVLETGVDRVGTINEPTG